MRCGWCRSFRGCSHYWRCEAVGTVTPYFRPINFARQSAGIPPVHDHDRKEYRGSIVHLAEDHAYEFELRDAKGMVLPGSRGTFRTWKSVEPVTHPIMFDETNFDAAIRLGKKSVHPRCQTGFSQCNFWELPQLAEVTQIFYDIVRRGRI